MQNTSTAVMQRRVAGTDNLDFYPTPPWATRALCEWLKDRFADLFTTTAYDPACGEHDMVWPLKEYFYEVLASDIAPHKGGHALVDFLTSDGGADFIITNPPFKLAEEFALQSVRRSRYGAAFLVRTAFLEGTGRFTRLFNVLPPTDVLQFSERVVMHHGKLSQFGSTATAYCWVVWRHGATGTQFHWLPPCRKKLERPGDYRE